jgi:hypothetical protein
LIVDPTRELLAAVIEQAVHDRRSAVTRGLVDKNANPLPTEILRKKIRNDEFGITSSLNWFFCHGGLEMALDAAGFGISPKAIKIKSEEPYG